MKPLSDLDITRRVDFELLKRNMSREQHRKNEESKQSMEMSVISEDKPENKKILMLMYEGKERVFFPIQMQKKESLVKLYPKDDSIQLKEAYISLPILLSSGRLRLYDPENAFELNAQNDEKNERSLKFVKHSNSDFVEAELPKDGLATFFDECNAKIFKKVIYYVIFLPPD